MSEMKLKQNYQFRRIRNNLFNVYTRYDKKTEEIEVILQMRTTGWVGFGWRPLRTCWWLHCTVLSCDSYQFDKSRQQALFLTRMDWSRLMSTADTFLCWQCLIVDLQDNILNQKSEKICKKTPTKNYFCEYDFSLNCYDIMTWAFSTLRGKRQYVLNLHALLLFLLTCITACFQTLIQSVWTSHPCLTPQKSTNHKYLHSQVTTQDHQIRTTWKVSLNAKQNVAESHV